ncbi:hypothetical protein [Hyphomicrobium sp.]|uniref:hypothetical protein n=1 Tax=Hyphomicrobium sp. TaxID=82 RepID=UPI001D2FAEB3|nr:hypothetical protein [Hyphomicrobium sp.]MBY0561549.1 hypothetical protein [Hyphomicrobium sp.]
MPSPLIVERLKRCDEARARWPFGAWDDEPDLKQWTDETSGLPCLILRNHMGALCGYVGVEEGNSLFGRQYDTPLPNWATSVGEALLEGPVKLDASDGFGVFDIFLSAMSGGGVSSLTVGHLFRAHGGITWTGKLQEARAPFADHWWFGFDCGHAGDYVPELAGLRAMMARETLDDPVMQQLAELHKKLEALPGWKPPKDVYRNITYVESWVTRLAGQLGEFATLEAMETQAE